MMVFFASRSRSLRIHQISSRDVRVAEKGLGVLGNPSADDLAWRFALSANERGRVHGVVFDNTFRPVGLISERSLDAARGVR